MRDGYSGQHYGWGDPTFGNANLHDLGHPGAIPSYYGETEKLEEGTIPPELSQAVALVSQWVEGKANTPEELEARIYNIKLMKTRFPFAATFFDNRVRRLQARRAALLRELRQQTQWRILGQSGATVGILVGAGALAWLIVSTTAKARR